MLPTIETERLMIRTPILGDEKPLNQAIKDSLSELRQWMPWATSPGFDPTIQFIRSGIENWRSEQQKDFPMIVILKETQEIIGASGYNDRSNPRVPFYEIGYWLKTQYTNCGLATELVNALTDYAFQTLKAVRVQIVIQVDNVHSIRVAEKCGFQIEAKLHHHCIDCISGKPADDFVFVRFRNGDN